MNVTDQCEGGEQQQPVPHPPPLDRSAVPGLGRGPQLLTGLHSGDRQQVGAIVTVTASQLSQRVDYRMRSDALQIQRNNLLQEMLHSLPIEFRLYLSTRAVKGFEKEKSSIG